MGNLKDTALLTKFSASYWNRNLLDKAITQETDERHATSGAGKYYKSLMKNCSEINHVTNIINSAYVMWKSRTMPWYDGGWRIIRSSNFWELKEALAKYKSQLEDAIRDLSGVWPDRVKEDLKRLNGISKPEDYPEAARLGELFSMDINAIPLTDSSDFRAVSDISEEQRKELQDAFEKEMKEKNLALKMQLREQVYEPLVKLHSICNERFEKTGKGVMTGKIHIADIKAIQRLCDVLPGLNVFDNAELDGVVAHLKESFGHIHDTKDFKNSRQGWIRQRTVEKIEEALSKLDSALNNM